MTKISKIMSNFVWTASEGHVVKCKKDSDLNFGVVVDPDYFYNQKEQFNRVIQYNLECLEDEDFKYVMRDFRSRSPESKGFANITLVLLHECGHIMTWKHQGLHKRPELYDDQEEYISQPDEVWATNWAIKWLEDEENREYAKWFEREFFKARRR